MTRSQIHSRGLEAVVDNGGSSIASRRDHDDDDCGFRGGIFANAGDAKDEIRLWDDGTFHGDGDGPCLECCDCGTHADPPFNETASLSFRVSVCPSKPCAFGSCDVKGTCLVAHEYGSGDDASSWIAFEAQDVVYAGGSHDGPIPLTTPPPSTPTTPAENSPPPLPSSPSPSPSAARPPPPATSASNSPPESSASTARPNPSGAKCAPPRSSTLPNSPSASSASPSRPSRAPTPAR
mmetsp:Transcript_20309/g.42922  ORF Transcript_20309/g.42922 Transcript_20309/m.42922 type:complete len:236 (+) Transcript_20309:120-827(+)